MILFVTYLNKEQLLQFHLIFHTILNLISFLIPGVHFEVLIYQMYLSKFYHLSYKIYNNMQL